VIEVHDQLGCPFHRHRDVSVPRIEEGQDVLERLPLALRVVSLGALLEGPADEGRVVPVDGQLLRFVDPCLHIFLPSPAAD